MGKSFDQFRHLDEAEYALEIAPLSPEELTVLHGRITRKLIAASMGTAQGTLCAPLTAGISLVPAAVGGRRVNVNLRRLKIIEARIAEIHAERYHKRKRDFAIPATVLGLSLGLAHGAESFFIEHLASDHAVHAASVATEMGQEHLYTAIHGQQATAGIALAAAVAPQLVGGRMPSVPSPSSTTMSATPTPTATLKAAPMAGGASYRSPIADQLYASSPSEGAPALPAPFYPTVTAAPPLSHTTAATEATASVSPMAAPPPPCLIVAPSTMIINPAIVIESSVELTDATIPPTPPPRPVSAMGYSPSPPMVPLSTSNIAPTFAVDTFTAPLPPERPASALGHERVGAAAPQFFPPPPLVALSGYTQDPVTVKSAEHLDLVNNNHQLPAFVKAAESPADLGHTGAGAVYYFPPPPTYQVALATKPVAAFVNDEKRPQTIVTTALPVYNPALYA